MKKNICNKITLIGSKHKENGNCNIKSLVDILEEIQPDVIFLEKNDYYPDFIYSQCLEIQAVKKFKEKHNNVETISIDTLDDNNFIGMVHIFESNSFIDYEMAIRLKNDIDESINIISKLKNDISDDSLKKLESESSTAYENIMLLKQIDEDIENETSKYGFEKLNTNELDDMVTIRQKLFKDYISYYRKEMIDRYEKYYDLLINEPPRGKPRGILLLLHKLK